MNPRAPTYKKRPIFYVTLSGSRGMPKRYIEYVMISAGGLWSTQRGTFIRRNPPSHTRFFLDSGGFTCLNKFGDYPWELSDYLDLIYHYKPDFAATMDYPCEPEINRKIYLGDNKASCALQSNEQRIEATVNNAIWLLDHINDDTPSFVVPVIQGYELKEYLACVDRYRALGVLDKIEYIAIGSMCRRCKISILAELVHNITDAVWTTHPDIKFHLFGLKLNALSNSVIFDRAHSIDSAAWSLCSGPGQMYIKDPVGAGLLDGYLTKVANVSREMEYKNFMEAQ